LLPLGNLQVVTKALVRRILFDGKRTIWAAPT
jgi:hypothetical protein